LFESVLGWLAGDLSPETIQSVIFVIRKGAHLAEYGILAALIWRGLRSTGLSPDHAWNWRLARLAVCLAALYAATDELHQSLVPSRTGSATDILIDSVGAILGALILHRWGIWSKWWPVKPEK